MCNLWLTKIIKKGLARVRFSRNGHLFFFFLTSIRNLPNYTISSLLEACYLCTSMGKLIMKTCWINLLLYLLFFTANKTVKQPSRAINRDKLTLSIQINTIRKSSKPILYYNSSATHRLIMWTELNWITLFEASYVIIKLHNSSHLLKVCLNNAIKVKEHWNEPWTGESW